MNLQVTTNLTPTGKREFPWRLQSIQDLREVGCRMRIVEMDLLFVVASVPRGDGVTAEGMLQLDPRRDRRGDFGVPHHLISK